MGGSEIRGEWGGEFWRLEAYRGVSLFRRIQKGRRYTRAMSETMDLTIVYEEGEEGWIVASIPAVPGVLSQGRGRRKPGRTSSTLWRSCSPPGRLRPGTSASASCCT